MGETDQRRRAIIEVEGTASALTGVPELLQGHGLAVRPAPSSAPGPDAVRAARMDASARTSRALAHEVANYLGTIRTMAYLLVEEVPEGSEARADVETVRETVEAGTRFLEAVRGFVHPEPLGDGPSDLNAVVRDAAAPLQDALASHGRVALRLVQGALWVRGDAGRLRRLVLDLGRAAAAGAPDGGVLTLATIAEGGDGTVGLTAEVPSRRVDADTLASFFEPFVADRGYEGGLRLPTVYAAVVGSGGGVSAGWAPEGGLAISLVLPAASAGPQQGAPP